MVKYRVKEILTSKRMSQGKLSRLADVSPSTVRRICSDDSYNASIVVLEKLAGALDVRISDLYVEKKNGPQKL